MTFMTIRYVHTSADLPKFRKLPMVVLGVSLGGCIAVNAIHQNGELFTGAILLAPMLSLEKVSKTGLNPYLRYFTISASFRSRDLDLDRWQLC